MKIKELSVFFPAYNEEKNIGQVVKSAVKILEDLALRYEILVIDDGSQDKTAEEANRMTKQNKNIFLIKHEANKGYGAALKTGFNSAKYQLIAFNDGDGQFDFADIKKFIPKLINNNLVIGYRVRRSDSFIRLVNAKLYSWFLRLLFGLKVKDIDCGFKVVKKEVIQKIPPLQSNGALISAELLIKAQKAGFKIGEVGVSHYPRTAGKPTGANLGVILRMFKEVVKLYQTLK